MLGIGSNLVNSYTSLHPLERSNTRKGSLVIENDVDEPRGNLRSWLLHSKALCTVVINPTLLESCYIHTSTLLLSRFSLYTLTTLQYNVP